MARLWDSSGRWVATRGPNARWVLIPMTFRIREPWLDAPPMTRYVEDLARRCQALPPKRMYLQLAASALMLGGNVLLAYGASLVLTRILGREGFGTYSVVIAVVTILTAPAFFGLPNLIGREVASAVSKGNFGLIVGIIKRSHHFIFGVSTIMIAGATIVCLAYKKFDATLLLGLPLILLMSLGAARSAMLRGIGKVLEGQWPEQLLRPALLVLFALTWIWLFGHLSPATAVGLTTLATLISVLVTTVQWRFARPNELKEAPPIYQDLAWVKAVIPFALSTGVLVVSAQISLVIIGALKGPEEVASFRVASQTAQMCAIGYTAAIMNISPKLSAAFAMGDRTSLQRTARHGAIFATAFCVPVAAAMILGGSPLMELMFGEGFGASAAPLAILALGQIANSAFGCGASILNMTGHERDCTIALGAGLLAQVILAFVLIPPFGALGGAIAAVIGVIGSNMLLRRFAIRRTGIDPAIWVGLFVYRERN